MSKATLRRIGARELAQLAGNRGRPCRYAVESVRAAGAMRK